MVPAVLHQATSNHHAEPNITAMSQGVCHPKWASHWYHVKHFVTVMLGVRQSKIIIVTHELYIGDSALWTAFWCNESQQLFQVWWRQNPYMNSPMITKYASDDYVCIYHSQKVYSAHWFDVEMSLLMAFSVAKPPWRVLIISVQHVNAYLEIHDDVIKGKLFPRYWPFVRGIHRSPVNSPH